MNLYQLLVAILGKVLILLNLPYSAKALLASDQPMRTAKFPTTPAPHFTLSREIREWKEYFNEGIAYGNAGDIIRAQASFRKAVLLAPKEPYPHYELGYTLSLTGRYNEALSEFNLTNELCRGFFLVQEEIYICEQVLSERLSREDAEILHFIRDLKMKERAGLSIEILKRSPDCALAHLHLGKALLDSNKTAARQSLQRCIQLHPDETTAIDAKTHLAILNRDNGNFKEAKELIDSLWVDYAGNVHLEVLRQFPILEDLTE